MKTWELLLLGCMLAATSHAQSRVIYEWKDANGVTHYSDQPQPGARKITLNGGSSMGTVVPSASSSAGTPAAAAKPVSQQYEALEIVSPANETSFFEPDEEIVVRVRAEPTLDSEDRLVTYLDNKPLGEVNQTDHRVDGLERGAHTLQSAIYGRDGVEKIRSEKITFHMKQTVATNPRNQGPALRPPPKPKPK
jgi:hypothetical protein